MDKLTQKKQQLRETLAQRCEKITTLSMAITGKGLANAFTGFDGHVDSFRADLVPANSVYRDDFPAPQKIASCEVRFYFYEWQDEEGIERDFQEALDEVDQYIAFLNLVLAKGQPLLAEAFGGVA